MINKSWELPQEVCCQVVATGGGGEGRGERRPGSKISVQAQMLYLSEALHLSLGQTLNPWLCYLQKALERWFSTFLILCPFNTVPHGVVTPNHKIFALLVHNYTFAIV